MIIITGIHGFIGTHLHDYLKRTLSPEETIFGITRENSVNIQEILERTRPHTIYHVGAELYDQDKMFDNNVVLTYHILEHCRKYSEEIRRLVILGSSSEYGRKYAPMAEDDPLEPETIYEGTKGAATLLARSYSYTYNIPILVIRPFTVYGPREKPTKFLQILLKKWRQRDETLAISPGVHDFVYIDDFIDALVTIQDKCLTPFEIVNIGSGTQTTNLEFVAVFEEMSGHQFTEYSYREPKSYDSEHWVCDTTKMRKYYPYPLTSLRTGMEKICKQYAIDNNIPYIIEV